MILDGGEDGIAGHPQEFRVVVAQPVWSFEGDRTVMLLVFDALCVADAVVGVVVALRSEIGVERQRATLPVLRQQAVSAADGGVGAPTGPEGSPAAIC